MLKCHFWSKVATKKCKINIFLSKFEQKVKKQTALQFELISLMEKELVVWMPVLRSYDHFYCMQSSFLLLTSWKKLLHEKVSWEGQLYYHWKEFEKN